MDDDILLALRLQANEHGIFDEEIINSLFQEFTNNEHQDIDDMLNKTFRSDFTNDDFDIQFTIDDNDETFMNDVNELKTFLYADECEIFTNNHERMLRMQVSAMSHPNQNTQQSVIDLLNQMMNNSGLHDMQGNNSGSLFGELGNMQNLQGSQFAGNAMFGNLFGGLGLGGFLNNMLNMQPVQVTLTNDALEKLEILKYDQVKEKLPNLDNNEQCSICTGKLDEDTDTSSYVILPCEHVFHDGCIKEWLKNHDYHCPICKCECGEHEAKIN